MIKQVLLAVTLFTILNLGPNNVYAACPMNNPAIMQKSQQIMQDCLGPADQNYDQRFIDMMIMHHQAALIMSQDALQKAQHPELRQMAQNIINNQTQEINQMQAWRQQWYGK